MIDRHGCIYIPTCDGCGAELPEEFDFRDAVDAMKLAGWRSIPPEDGGTEWMNLCQACAARWDYD